MKNLLDINCLYLYTQVVQARSFAQVSSRLKIPKPTLSRKIQSLEAQLATQLLIRTTRSVRPTEIGREFYQHALQVINASEQAESLVQKTKLEPQGLLRVSVGVEYGMAVVSPLTQTFLERYPEVSVELDLTGRQVDLAQEGYDVAIRIGPLADSSLGSKKLGVINYGLFASQRFLKKSRSIRHPDDLKKHPALAFTRSRTNEKWRLVRGAEELLIETQPKLSSNNFWVLKQAAERGLGVVFMPRFMADEAIEEGTLEHVLPEWTSANIVIHAIYPEQRYLSPKVRAYIDHMAAALAEK